MAERTVAVPFKCTFKMAETIDKMVEKGYYASRGEAIRHGILLLKKFHNIED